MTTKKKCEKLRLCSEATWPPTPDVWMVFPSFCYLGIVLQAVCKCLHERVRDLSAIYESKIHIRCTQCTLECVIMLTLMSLIESVYIQYYLCWVQKFSLCGHPDKCQRVDSKEWECTILSLISNRIIAHLGVVSYQNIHFFQITSVTCTQSWRAARVVFIPKERILDIHVRTTMESTLLYASGWQFEKNGKIV